MRALSVVACLLALLSGVGDAQAGGKGGAKATSPVAVSGHVTKDGTYVPPHYRTAPDASFSNNWSTVGNVNPYTGKPGTKVSPGQYSGAGIDAGIPTQQSYYPLQAAPAQSYQPSGQTSYTESAHQPSDTRLPPHAKLTYLGNDWDCERGFRKAGGGCAAVALPLNAKLTYLGNDWECERGYRRAGAECTAVGLPAHARLNYLGNDWECEHGYRRTGAECSAVVVPANAKLTYLGTDWECAHGFRRQGAACSAVEVPANARLTYLGNDWECERGFRRNGGACSAVQVPPNGKLTYLGSDWECERGYRRSGPSCVPVY